MRAQLLPEVLRMAVDSLRIHKLRSALTITGIVIGITLIVGMTSLIRGFDRSLREYIEAMGPRTIFISKFSGVSFMSGEDLAELLRRPNLTVADAKAIARQARTLRAVDVWLGGNVIAKQERLFYRSTRTKPLVILGASESFPEVNLVPLVAGRFFTETEVRNRRRVVVLGQTAYQSLFPFIDPIGKRIRIGDAPYSVLGVLASRPSPGGFDTGQNDFVVIPHTTYEREYGVQVAQIHGNEHEDVIILAVPRFDVPREAALRDVEQILRIRHGLRADEANDFDLVTQDAALRVFDQLTQATFFALVVLSSIALLVGGIGVMAVMTLSVTERTGEIGLRKALGARRREILAQFLVEAAVLTSIGGVMGVLLGAATGLTVHLAFGFPISLPAWSFALALGFSGGVGLLFGMIPAVKASRLDPIAALRYE